jgi:hypothetical protein
MSDRSPRSLGRDFFIMARGGKAKKKSGQDQSKAARDKRRKMREAAKKAAGVSRYSQTPGDK